MSDRAAVIQGLIELHMAGKGGPEAVAAMKQILAQTKEVDKAVGGLGTGITKTGDQVGILEKQFGSLQKTVAGYFAAGVVANFLRDSYIGFARTERQALAVENQIKSLGQAAEGAGFREFIAQLSLSSGILDDDLVPAFQRALLAFKDYDVAQERVTAAARFAAAGIGDVQSNTEAMSRFFNTGAARSLVQFGVNVKGGETAVLSLTEGFRLLDEQLEKQPKAFNDAQRKIELLRIAANEARHALGFVIDKLSDPWFSKFGVKAQLGPQVAGPEFGPQPETATQRQAREEQERRDSDAKQKAADDAVKIERDRLAKVADLNEKNDESILSARISAEEAGSTERLRLELELNEKVRAAAVQNAKDIRADVSKVNALFDALAEARRVAQAKAAASGPEQEPGAGGEPPEVKAAREESDAKIRIKEEEAKRWREIEDMEAQASKDQHDRNVASLYESAAQIEGALAQIFAKHKGFAIGMAIMETGQAIMQVWADPAGGPWYVKLAKAIAVAAIGAAQIASIRSATVSGGGGTAGGGGAAASPTSQAYGGVAAPPSFTAGSGESSVRMSQKQFETMTSPAQTGSSQGVVINIKNAFGDKRSMRKLTREISRNLRNNQGDLR